MTPRTWYLVRHGQTEWNAASRLQGQWNSPLTALGREQARHTARLLGNLGVDAMFASPLGRVRETVAILNEVLHVPVTFDRRLMEWSAGDWSGRTHAEIGQTWPDEWAAWRADRYWRRSPNGENFHDLVARARAFMADPVSSAGARIAVVGHGFLNRALAATLLSLAPAETLRIHQSNDTVIRLAVGAGEPTADHFVNGDGPRPGLPRHVPPPGDTA